MRSSALPGRNPVNTSSIRISANNYINLPMYSGNCQNKCVDHPMTQFRNYIFDIIQIISTTLDIQSATERVNSLLTIIYTKEDLYNTIDLLETTVVSVVGNIHSGVSIDIVKCRIQYIRSLIEKLSSCDYGYPSLSPYIFDLMELIITSFDLPSIIEKATTFKTSLQDDARFIKFADEVQKIILSIISNIQSGTDINIVRCRIMYLQDLVSKFSC